MVDQTRARILFLDDNEDMRNTIRGALETLNFEVTTAESASEVVELLRQDGSFDLAIFDMRLDEKDEQNIEGAKLAIQLRDDGHEFPIIIFTAYVPGLPAEIALKFTQTPYRVSVVRKQDLLTGTREDLIFQINSLLSWRKRTVQVFVAMPFNKDFDGAYEAIKTATDKLKIELKRVDKDAHAGYIPTAIRNYLRKSSLVVADLTGSNLDVVYELGYAQALGKPVLLICQDYADLPQGIEQDLAIRYDPSWAGTEWLSSQLVQLIEKTLDTPIPHRKFGKPQILPKTFAAFIPSSPEGDAVHRNILDPVVTKLGFSVLYALRPEFTARALDEDMDRIREASVVLADISEHDPRIYYNVGACDALRTTGVVLLVRQGVKPSFNLQGRANIVEYDIERKEAVKAQGKLRERIEAAMGIRANELSEAVHDQQAGVAAKRDELLRLVRGYYDQSIERIEAYSNQNWSTEEGKRRLGAIDTARRTLAILEQQVAGFTSLTVPPPLMIEMEDKRKELAKLERDWELAIQSSEQLQDDIIQMRGYIGTKADEFHELAERAETIELLDSLMSRIKKEGPSWHNDAITQIPR